MLTTEAGKNEHWLWASVSNRVQMIIIQHITNELTTLWLQQIYCTTHTDRQTDRQRETDILTYRQTDRQTEIQTDRQTGRDRYTDIQTDRDTDLETASSTWASCSHFLHASTLLDLRWGRGSMKMASAQRIPAVGHSWSAVSPHTPTACTVQHSGQSHWWEMMIIKYGTMCS